jgi:transmembrane sensor
MQALSDALLARYLAGECSPDETREVERWADEAPAHRARLDELRRIWSVRRPAHVWDTQEIWSNVQLAMRAGRRRPLRLVGDHLRGREHRWWNTRIAVIAAAILVVATSTVLLHIVATAPNAPASVAMHEYATTRGQRATITLLDGTRVELGVDSRLQVASFESGRREVHLNGEAVFSVVHDPARPFVVRAGNGVTEDLGTEFAVRAYPADSQVTVVVVSGRVALREDTDSTRAPTVLDAGQLGRLDRDGSVHLTRGVDPSLFLAWTKGRLVFRDAMLRDVATQLERWFDVEIRMSDSALAARRVSATVNVQSLDDVLAAVTFPLGIRYTRTGRVIELTAETRGR